MIRGDGAGIPEPLDDFPAHRADIGPFIEKNGLSAGDMNPAEIDPSPPHREDPGHQRTDPHLGLGPAGELRREGRFLRHPVVCEGHGEQGARRPGGLQAAQQAALRRQKLAGAAPLPFDEEFEGLALTDQRVNPAGQLRILAAHPPPQVEGMHRGEHPAQDRDLPEFHRRGDVGNGDAQVGPGEG